MYINVIFNRILRAKLLLLLLVVLLVLVLPPK